MPLYRDDAELADIRMVQTIVGLYERRPGIQRIVQLGLLARRDDDDDDDEEDYEYNNWVHVNNHSRGYTRVNPSDWRSDWDRTRPSASVHQHSAACDLPLPPSGKAQPKECDTERRARLLQESKKSKLKAQRKQLKKQKKKARRRLEKEKQNPVKSEEGEELDQQSKAKQSKPVDDSSKNDSNSSVKRLASAQDADSSEDDASDEDSDDNQDSDNSEELDMTSTFVSKAALIARRKIEQKPKPERVGKNKTPVKEGLKKKLADEPNEDHEVEKKNYATFKSPTFEENFKMSTDLANFGNRAASAGDFNMAVKYFTDAIKCNPTEFKLFSNRSFCFEKMQEYGKALADAELSLSMCPDWVKGLFRKGRALAGLKRYEEAAQAFTEVLKLESSCADAAQELMHVQITELMAYGFTRKQSSNALIMHGTVKEALEVLSQLSLQQGAIQTAAQPPAQVANVTGFSPVLSANTNLAPPQSQEAPKRQIKNQPLGPVHNMSNLQSQPKPIHNQAMKSNNQHHQCPQELFPVWVGNLNYPVPESLITNLFSKAGTVHSTKVLLYKRCAFVNFTKQEHCDEAIRRFHGYELNSIRIVVRYPDRIPPGMGISRSALKADDLQDENVRQNDYVDGRNAVGSRGGLYRHYPNYKANNKQ